MAIAVPAHPSVVVSNSKGHKSNQLNHLSANPNSANPMSQDFHHHHHPQGIFNFPHGFDVRPQDQEHHHHIAQQIRRDKLRVPGFEPQGQPLVPMDEDVSGEIPVYETPGNMLSEMFNFPPTDLLQNQISQNYDRNSRPPSVAVGGSEWYGSRLGMGMGPPMGDSKNQTVQSFTVDHHRQLNPHHHQHHQISNMNEESSSSAAAAMQLFLMNPQQQQQQQQQLRSPPSPSQPHETSSNTLHMLLPNPSISSSNSTLQLQGFHNSQISPGSHVSQTGGGFGQFTWVSDSITSTVHGGGTNPGEIGGGIVEGQGLSLSLSSSLQQLGVAKAEELRLGEGGGGGGAMLFFNQGGSGDGSGGAGSNYSYKNFVGGNQQIHVGYGTSLGVVNVLRNSKYVKAAQELLEEFCSVGRGQFKKNKFGRQNSISNPNPSSGGGGSGGGGSGSGGGSSTSKDIPSLSAADRIEHQRRKVKLLTMIDEVDRRYNHYCEQMQMVVNSFDMVMGFGSAIPYTALAQKAMSRHFRCLKDAIAAQLKHSCELLGDKDAGTSGVTKGETPRLKLLEQSLRQQRAFHQMGMMEQEAWRPQRGLPERSVNILRAWLFEHFLHPYPSDADKHLLARQTGLSRNQVSNWFINARVRLWKPMVEDMYQQESKEEADEVVEQEHDEEDGGGHRERIQNTDHTISQTPTPSKTTAAAKTTLTPAGKRPSEINATESDPSRNVSINRQCFSENQATHPTTATVMATSTMAPPVYPTVHGSDTCRSIGIDYGTTATAAYDDASAGNAAAADATTGSTLIRFGTTSGDVSLTLGLRHAGGNVPEKNPFSVRDFGGF